MRNEPRDHDAVPARTGESGMSLVEVMVAMVLLLIGMLGVISMLDTSNQVTRRNLARDTANSLAREQLERAREIAYADLADPAKVATALAPGVEGSDTPVSAVLTTTRRGVRYTTTITSCVLDDPIDGIGVAPGTACTPVTGPDVPPQVPSGPGSSTISLNILGIPVTGSGGVVTAVCNLLGYNSSVLNPLIGAGGTLGGLISSGADANVCSSGQQVAVDRQPADVTAVTATVTWSAPQDGRLVQRAIITGPRVRA